MNGLQPEPFPAGEEFGVLLDHYYCYVRETNTLYWKGEVLKKNVSPYLPSAEIPTGATEAQKKKKQQQRKPRGSSQSSAPTQAKAKKVVETPQSSV